jgi:dTDP-glucose 4,6-dehydratase
MRILITGGAGFLGANLVKFLAAKHPDYSISALDAAGISEAEENIGKEVLGNPLFSYWQGDVRDKNLAANLVRNADVLVHLAAKTAGEDSTDETRSFFEANVSGTLSVVEAARAHPPDKLLHISSADVYGTAPGQPVTEDMPLLPCGPYGGSKAGADNIVSCFARAYGLPCLIIRPFDIYGPLQRPGALIPDFITDAIDGKAINVPGDGSSSRDCMFAEDFCRAADGIIHADFENLSGEIINLGTGKGETLNEIAGAVLEILGRSESSIRFVENKPGESGRMVASASKAEVLTGWKPSFSLADGLKRTVNWYMENQDWWRKRKK